MAMLLIFPLVSMNAFAAGTVELKSYTTTIDPRGSMVIIGKASGLTPFVPITLTVTDPSGKVIYSPTVSFDSSGNFKYTIQPTLPKFATGTFTVEATHRDLATPVTLTFEVHAVGSVPSSGTSTSSTCTASELSAMGKCMPFNISGATVSGSSIDKDSNAIVIKLATSNEGTLTINPSNEIIQGISLILVDGQQWDDVTISGNEVTVTFPAGTEKIEVLGTSVIPEFGTITALILVMSIAGIILMTRKHKSFVFPKI
jgi:predicted secreted protein with PEFG-CTERM motif